MQLGQWLASPPVKAFFAGALFLMFSSATHALPAYSEQTGERCASCHIQMGELTPRGRRFKLLAYAEGEQATRISLIGTASFSKIASTSSSADPSVAMPKNGELLPESVSGVIAGKFAEGVGGKIKWTGNLLNTSPIYGTQGVQTGSKVGRDLFLDASEVRVAKRDAWNGKELIYGLSFNNAPTQQDLWNTTPVNSFPYKSSSLINAWGLGQFGPTTLIDGGLTSQTVGLSVFGMLDNTWFIDIGNYWKLATNLDVISVAGPQNTLKAQSNPYWRLARNADNGPSSWMVGTFGTIMTLARDPLVVGSASGTYKDIGIDAGYQHITDTHTWSTQAVMIREIVDWSSRSVGRSHDGDTSTLTTFKAKVSYNYARRYGASVFGFASRGSTDNLYWAYNPDPNVVTGACNQTTSMLAFCSQNGKPNTRGFGFELTYSPWPTTRLALQQTFYQSFLGGATFVDNSSGNPRSARDNNLTYLYAVYSY